MDGIDIYAYMQRLSGRLDGMTERGEIDKALDEMEYLFEVIDPELQHLAEDLIARLRDKLFSL